MATLPAVLTDDAVDVVDLRTTLEPDAFRERAAAVADARNRAAAAAVRDEDGRLLLARAGDAWRLPGTGVGAVEDFVAELRERARSAYALELAAVRPRWVYRQAAEHAVAGGPAERGGRTAPLYYVVCEADLTGAPREGPQYAETRWFAAPPENLVNPTVVRDRFEP